MCGIAGAKGPKERIDETAAAVRRMVHALSRRGPDGAGFGEFEGMAFGHARLAIIDLTTGDQPQFNGDDSVAVVVNGEIYNYVELRKELEARGHRFRTHSDIEVIPHLYDEMGTAFVDRLRGMFAIALYDRKRDSLLLMRDRLGKKPIYYMERNGVIYFASELKSMLEVPGADFTIDRTAVEDYLTFQYIPAPKTIFKEVKKVPAASFIEWRDGRSRMVEYWNPKLDRDEQMTEEKAIAEVERILDEATRIRLRSDVPLGTFLSGGIDSNIVTATAAAFLPGKLRTTTIAFGDANASEVALARRAAERLKTNHCERSAAIDVLSAVEDVADYLDEPLGDSSTVPTYLVSKAARESVTVAISGDGGDETFGGYAFRYHQNVMLDGVRRMLPGAFGRGVFGLLARVYPKGDNLPRSLRLKWGLENLSVSAEDAYCLDMSIFRPRDKAALYRPEFTRSLGDYESFRHLKTYFERTAGSDDLLSRLLYVDLKTYLADGVLAKVDRMSMANSLEVRSPLLDHELVEFACRVPSRLKLVGRTGKYLLRKIADKKVGKDIASAPKVGFAPPLGAWLKAELKELLESTLFAKDAFVREIFDDAGLRRIFDEHQSGVRNHERLLWLVLSLEMWRDRFGKRKAGLSCVS